MFSRLCKTKARKYKDNPDAENKGILYKACNYIYPTLFDKLDNEIKTMNAFQKDLGPVKNENNIIYPIKNNNSQKKK